ncbi:MAG: hypothetical protein IJE10_11165 [Clostridia bacterium]|nr:hypothetical protein [Clostridia bacterium]
MKRQYQIHTAKHQFPFFAFPLVSDDVNAYEIVLTAPEDISNCSFEVTAFRADGKKLLGLGRCFGNRATYVMENEMHSVVGDLTVRTAVVSPDGSCLTTNELLFKVEKPNGADAIAAGTNTGVLTQILVNISQMNQELNEKINSSKLEAVSESKMYTDGCVEKLEKSFPACEIEGKAVLVCAQHYVSTDEITELDTQDSGYINLTVSGDLTVDISAKNKYVFFNPSTDEKLICTVFVALTGDVKELELYAPDTDTTAFTLETFKETYPYYGVLAENKWESANDLLKPAFDYAETYTDNKVGDTSIKHETTVDIDVSDSKYVLDFSLNPIFISKVTLYEDPETVDDEAHDACSVEFYYADGSNFIIGAEEVSMPVVFNKNEGKAVVEIRAGNGNSDYVFVNYTWFTKSDVSVKEYVDDKVSKTLSSAKLYADEKLDDAKKYADGEKTIVLPERLTGGVYELPDDCVGVKSATIIWNETLTGSDTSYIYLWGKDVPTELHPEDAKGRFEYFYADGLTQEIVFTGFENRSDVKNIISSTDVCESGIVSITYYTKTKANAYTDASIQQAILDSWEVGV